MKLNLKSALGSWLKFGNQWLEHQHTTDLCTAIRAGLINAPFKFALLTFAGVFAGGVLVLWPAIVGLVWLQTGVLVTPEAFAPVVSIAGLLVFILGCSYISDSSAVGITREAYRGWKNNYCPVIEIEGGAN